MLITLAGMLLVTIVMGVAITLHFTAENSSYDSFVWAAAIILASTVLIAVRTELKG